MNASELLNKAGIPYTGMLPSEISGLALRAEDVRPGYAFLALKGGQHDGADFIPAAEQNGAALVLAERPVSATIPVVVVPALRQKMAILAGILYPSDDVMKVAVTGTNGKTSTVFYVQQLLNRLGIPAASLGTIGIDTATGHTDGSMTTPDPITLNKTLHTLQERGIRVVAMEASSHGLDQGRLGGLTLRAGAFTNLTQDHLDYHKTMDAYLAAKSRLFSECVAPDGVAVLNADDAAYDTLRRVAEARGLSVFSYGKNGNDLRLMSQTPTDSGQDIVFMADGREERVSLCITGDFQVWNVLAALGLCRAVGASLSELVAVLPMLQAPTGRLEQIGTTPAGARVFVDYAHTPDAIERVLTSLRPHTSGRLVCLMGCGGNRDTGKRALMGAAAHRLADVVYITDDNPRFENPADIRAAIVRACPGGIEMDNRERAIHTAVASLRAGDVLVIAGKGHEPGQTINGITYALDDRVEARLALMRQTQEPLWIAADLELALSVRVADYLTAFGISIDTRTLKIGDLFIALQGVHSDGHAFARRAVELGAAACVVMHPVDQVPADKQIVVSDTMAALEALARFARMRCTAQVIGITGSSGKTTTKEMVRTCLAAQGKTYATDGNLNNQIGVPLTLAALPSDARFAVIEMGMNHSGELIHLSDMVRPDMTIITSVGSAHRAFFKTERDIALAKSEIFDYQNRQGTAVLQRDGAFYDLLKTAATGQGIQHILTFGQDGRSDFVLKKITPDETGMQVDWADEDGLHTLHLAYFGAHFALDALGALALVKAVGGDLKRACETLTRLTPARGRGAALSVVADGKHITVIDDAYNANPASMAASLQALGLRSARRKIAVLGDMLELGPAADDMHTALVPAVLESGADVVYTVGPLMQKLFQALPPEKQGKATETAEAMIPVIREALQDGDLVFVKASHGTGLYKVIDDLKGKH